LKHILKLIGQSEWIKLLLFYIIFINFSTFGVPDRSLTWDNLFNLSFQHAPVLANDLPLSEISQHLGVYSAPYPDLKESIDVAVALDTDKMKHPKFTPDNRVEWTEKQRNLVHNHRLNARSMEELFDYVNFF
jgi:hypothetical protein